MRKVLTLGILVLLAAAMPAYAWLYDAGPAGIWGAVIAGPESIYGGSPGAISSLAQRFYLPWDADISQFGAALSTGTGSSFVINLVSGFNTADQKTLGTWTVKPPGAAMQYVYWNIDTVSLKANTDYALTFTQDSTTGFGGLAYVTRGLYLAQGLSIASSTWGNLPYPTAIRIGGTAFVPEPSAFAALASGLAGLGLAAGRRKARNLS